MYKTMIMTQMIPILNNDIKWQQFEDKIEKFLPLISTFSFLSSDQTILRPFGSLVHFPIYSYWKIILKCWCIRIIIINLLYTSFNVLR